MKLLLNGRNLDESLTADSTLGSALAEVQENCVTTNEVISAIWVDGQQLTAEQLSEWKHRPVDEFEETRVEALDRRTLAGQALKLLAQGLAESHDDRKELTEDLNQGRTADGMTKLGAYLNLWNATQKSMVSACHLLDIDIELPLDELPPEKADIIRRVNDEVARLVRQLTEMKSALEAGDHVLVADILSYEFEPITNDWIAMLNNLANSVQNN